MSLHPTPLSLSPGRTFYLRCVTAAVFTHLVTYFPVELEHDIE